MSALAKSSRYMTAIASAWGICQRNMMQNTTNASMESAPVAAAQPMTGGIAPGTAPTTLLNEVVRLSGVYKNR